MNKIEQEELLYNKIYEQTKDFGRTHFIKEIMRLNRENTELKEDIKGLRQENDNLINAIPFKENKKLKDKINKAIEYIENDLQSFLYSIEYKNLLEILKGE